MNRFEDRTVLVTGAAGGIGSATCRRFAAEGARVAVLDIDLPAAERVAEALRAQGGQAAAVACDVTRRASVDAAVASAEHLLGPADVLVNNAGWDVFRPFLETQPPDWDRIVAINLTGAFHMHHAVLPGMAARGRGRVVNIASDAGRIGSSGEAVYAACKGGLIAFSKTLAREHARHGITVNCVCPGPVQTALFDGYLRGRRTPTSCCRPSCGPFRSAASRSRRTCLARSPSSPATMPPT